jgi:hypothetical protein
LDDAAFGAASEVTPKFVSPSDPAAQWTGALRGPAFFAYANNYLIDTDNAIIVDVEATRAIRQAEVGAARTMIDRVTDCFGLKPEWLAGDSAYGAAPMLAWLVKDKRSPRIYRCSTDPGETMALSHGPTLPSMLSTMFMCVRKASCSERLVGFMTAERCSTGHKRPSAICARSN